MSGYKKPPESSLQNVDVNKGKVQGNRPGCITGACFARNFPLQIVKKAAFCH